MVVLQERGEGLLADWNARFLQLRAVAFRIGHQGAAEDWAFLE